MEKKQDISQERNINQRNIRQNQDCNQFAFEQALAQIGMRYWEYNIKTKRLYRSKLVQDEVGYDAYKDNVPESYIEQHIIHPAYEQAYLDFYHSIQDGHDARLQFQSRFKDGSWGWLDIAYKVLFDEKGRPDKAIGVGGNVTHIKKKDEKLELREQQLEIALKEARYAENAKLDFLSRMSHDLRTPLNSIINLSTLAIDKLDQKENLQQDLEKVSAAGEFMLGLINDILDMTRIEKQELHLTPCVYTHQEFVNYLESVIKPMCDSREMHFERKNENGVDEPLWIDKTRFNQIFFNLLSNAVKYTPVGGNVEFTENRIAMNEGLVCCEFRVSDNGQGMSERFQEKMYEPFEREVTENAFVGSGLGLPITKRLVELMGGTIRIKSKVGVGTTAIVQLMLPVATKEQIQEAQLEMLTGAEKHQYSRVLIVEDHPLNREIASRILEKGGYLTECVQNGAEAVEKMKECEPSYYNAILMDIRMPVMDGLTATRKIRKLKNGEAASIPIIAMTANAFDTDRKTSLEAGMNEHLSKPIDPKKLYETLAVYTGKTM